jgi:hypothetical protein
VPESGVRVEKRQLGLAAVCIGVVAYGWWFTGLEPFSPAALRALLLAAAVLIVAAEVRREHPPDPERAAPRTAPHYRAAIAVWSSIAAAVIAWEVIALRGSPRPEHPTISYLIENVEHNHVARLALFVGWIWFGWRLAS